MAKKRGISQDQYLLGVEAGYYRPRGRPIKVFNEKEIEEIRDLFVIHVHIKVVERVSKYCGKLLRDLHRDPEFIKQVDARREELERYMASTRIY